jgi:glycolate oxidase iron-sulfur subunit
MLVAGRLRAAVAGAEHQCRRARVLDRLGISLFERGQAAGCCGAVRFHLNDQEAARTTCAATSTPGGRMSTPGVEAIVVTASGCGVQVRDYGHLLADDPDYAEKAARISLLCRDPSEVLASEKAELQPLPAAGAKKRGKLAFHSPCTLQHGLKIRGAIEEMLLAAGYELTAVADSHLCCGSAGTYSFLQPELSGRLRDNKLAALNAGGPALVATANIGCLTHLQAGSPLPVRHWIELIDEVFE